MSYPKSGLGFTYQCTFQGVEVARAYPTIPMRGRHIYIAGRLKKNRADIIREALSW